MKNLIQKGKERDGFTMMELVVTLAILGILMSASIPAYNGVAERTQNDPGSIFPLFLPDAPGKRQDRPLSSCPHESNPSYG